MSTFIILILNLFLTDNTNTVKSENSYYANQLILQPDLHRCTVSPCPNPKDY